MAFKLITIPVQHMSNSLKIGHAKTAENAFNVLKCIKMNLQDRYASFKYVVYVSAPGKSLRTHVFTC